MADAIHTPGPWEYLAPVGSNDFVVSAWDRDFRKGVIRIAYVPNKIYTHMHGWPEHNQRHANARLICAAPELLAALIAVLPSALVMINENHAGMKLARAAIAKATGSAS